MKIVCIYFVLLVILIVYLHKIYFTYISIFYSEISYQKLLCTSTIRVDLVEVFGTQIYHI